MRLQAPVGRSACAPAHNCKAPTPQCCDIRKEIAIIIQIQIQGPPSDGGAPKCDRGITDFNWTTELHGSDALIES